MSIAIDGADHLLFRHMAWSEALGEVPRGTVDLLSLEKAVDPRKILGKQAKVRLQLPHDRERFFNGYVARFTRGGGLGRYFEYVAEVRPWLWLLSRTADCRIFQRMKVDAVLRGVFDRHAFADYELKLNGSYPEMDYCVQYRETDLAFVNRLCERFGLYYWFEYTSDGHQKLRIVDSLSTHEDAPGYESLPFHPATSNPLDSEHIASLHAIDPVLPGKFVAQDYNYETSTLDLKAEAKVDHKHDHDDLEVFDYPGPFVDLDGATAETKLRGEISDCTFATYDAVTNAQGIRTGATFKVTQHPDTDINNKKFQVTASTVSMHWAGYESHGADQGASFRCTFTSIPANVQFRLPRRTEKPVVYGPQTAVVVGPDGEEIHTDKFGRVRVLFHWDRYGKAKRAKDGAAIAPDDRSCWIRVAQFWAGNRFGAVFIPRIGHEVVVDFIDGDPDRPIAVGCVYNDKNLPPWLPDNPTQSGVLTRSSKGGSAANANALRFEDKKGSEQVWLHAEKNQDIEVENDETHSVGHDRTKTIDHDETTHVKHDRTETVDNNETITIGVNRTESVGSNETITIGSNRSISVGGNETATVAVQRSHAVGVNESIAIGAAQEIAIGAAQTVAIGAAQAVTVGANQTVNVGADQSTSVGANQSLDVGSNRSMTIGKDLTSNISKNENRSVGEARTTSVGKDDSLTVGKNLVIDAADSVTIKTGDASITMKKDGTITIKGKDITLDGSGKINVKASGDVVIKGSKVGIN
ncbi:MAG TPA: type VI secretion system tip protein TssI/VgrG [Burkholderiaceae bacterium]|nr:type VI secretion system tip protein TssI/VgrG [Burkholderiaceae bacterium]